MFAGSENILGNDAKINPGLVNPSTMFNSIEMCLAGLATPVLGVERESPRGVTMQPGIGGIGKKLPDLVKCADIGGRSGAGCLADGRLVDFDDGPKGFSAQETCEAIPFRFSDETRFFAQDSFLHHWHEEVSNQSGFTRS